MVKMMELTVPTMAAMEYVNITDRVSQLVESAGISEGTAFVISRHTTTGIMVNEALECLQSDMEILMEKLAPETGTFSHARMLHSYGQSADNAPSHLRAMLTNNHCIFPVRDGKLLRRFAQDIFLAEYDGPQDRTLVVVVIGE